jgi:hypothetical protein
MEGFIIKCGNSLGWTGTGWMQIHWGKSKVYKTEKSAQRTVKANAHLWGGYIYIEKM